MRSILTILFFFLLGSTFSQETTKESLWKNWRDAQLADSARLNSFKDLIYSHYCYQQPDSALELCNLLEEKAKAMTKVEWVGHAYNLRGITLNVKGEISASLSS